MQAEAFPRTSGARNPIVIVKIIFLSLNVVLQVREGGAIWRAGPDTGGGTVHQKNLSPLVCLSRFGARVYRSLHRQAQILFLIY